ncbi:hypothetical protein Bca101_032236 [Brassica carinata]
MAKKKCEQCDGVAAASPRRSIAPTTARPVGFHRAANPASSSSVIRPCFSSKSGVETIAKKKVEDVMPIATGHEKEELEAELEGRRLLNIDFRVWSLFNHTNLLPLLDHAIISVKCMFLCWNRESDSRVSYLDNGCGAFLHRVNLLGC